MPQLTTAVNQPTGIQVVESLFEAFRAMDLERAFALLSEEIVYQNVPLPPHRGKEAVERVLRGFARVMTSTDIRVLNIAERNNIVLTERIDVGRGRFFHVEFWVCGTFEVKNGKIVLWRDRFDLGELLLQLATSPIRRLLLKRTES